MRNFFRSSFFNIFKWFLIIALTGFILIRIYYALTDDFRLGNITHPVPYEKNWNIPAPSVSQEREIQQILQQPFTYLGKGAQSYAFASEDGKYILKFFKFKHLRPSLFLEMLPSIGPLKAYKEKQAVRKDRKLFGVFNSYKLAYDVDRNESGLVFIQLNSKHNPQRYVILVDKIGIKHRVDLQYYPFILQYKGETLRVVIDKLLKEGNIETAALRLEQILDLYASEYRQGIYDHDHGVMQNTGFIQDQPIHLDVGKLMRQEEMRDSRHAKKDAELVISKMKNWVDKYYPEYAERISRALDKKVQELFTQ